MVYQNEVLPTNASCMNPQVIRCTVCHDCALSTHMPLGIQSPKALCDWANCPLCNSTSPYLGYG